jgi:transcriptional regulator with XRE-family HTH domain
VKNVLETLFSTRLRTYQQSQALSTAEIARFLSLSPQYVGRLLRGERTPSRRTIAALDHLEGEATKDQFLSACETILKQGDDSILHGFTMNIFSVMTNIDPKEALRLKNAQRGYLERRRRERRARDTG